MLVKTKFQSNANNKEILPMEQSGLPYVCHVADRTNFKDGNFPWHWHSAIEINHIEAGEVEFRTIDKSIHLYPGDAVFINSGVLHSYHSDHVEDVKYYAHLFDVRFLSPKYDDLIDRKYIKPVSQCNALSAYLIRPDSARRIKMTACIVEMMEYMRDEPLGFELMVRNALSKFWCLFLEETEEIRKNNVPRRNPDTERMKVMISYIQQHFAERLTLDDIAASANIGNRECLRCFQRSIDNTPVNYLNDYRIQMAAEMLLRLPDSITDISEACGFSSVNYFGKVFREATGFTPSDYRKHQK